MFVGYQDGGIQQFDLHLSDQDPTRSEKFFLLWKTNSVTAIHAFWTDENKKNILVTGGKQGNIQLLDITDPQNFKIIKNIQLENLGDIVSIYFHATKEQIFISTHNGDVLVLNPDGKIIGHWIEKQAIQSFVCVNNNIIGNTSDRLVPITHITLQDSLYRSLKQERYSDTLFSFNPSSSQSNDKYDILFVKKFLDSTPLDTLPGKARYKYLFTQRGKWLSLFYIDTLKKECMRLNVTHTELQKLIQELSLEDPIEDKIKNEPRYYMNLFDNDQYIKAIQSITGIPIELDEVNLENDAQNATPKRT